VPDSVLNKNVEMGAMSATAVDPRGLTTPFPGDMTPGFNTPASMLQLSMFADCLCFSVISIQFCFLSFGLWSDTLFQFWLTTMSLFSSHSGFIAKFNFSILRSCLTSHPGQSGVSYRNVRGVLHFLQTILYCAVLYMYSHLYSVV